MLYTTREGYVSASFPMRYGVNTTTNQPIHIHLLLEPKIH